MSQDKKITCGDIAEHFNLNKSTVSRALAGKGSMREDLRQEIIRYAKNEGYMTRTEKKRAGKTNNIAVVLPRNLSKNSAFFAESLMGISECLSLENKDVIVATEEGNTLTRLKEIVENHKCDGVILLQVYDEDVQTSYLTRQDIPFIAVGTLSEECYQIDSDMRFAARELVSGLLSQGCRKIAYVGGRRNYTVNRRRYRGYEQALEEQMIKVNPEIVFHDVETSMQIRYTAERILKYRCDCIVCGDDLLAREIFKVLVEEGVHVPEEIKLASLYNSIYTELNYPAITAVSIDAREEGFHAAQLLMDIMSGKRVDKVTKVKAFIKWRESTGDHDISESF